MTLPLKVAGPLSMASDPIMGLAPATKQYADAQTKTFLPIANGTHFNGNFGNASTSLIQTRCRQSRKLLRVIAGGADQIQVEWANKYTTTAVQSGDASCELNGPNAVTVRMAIEYPAGNPRIVSGSTTYSAGTAYAVGDQVVSSGVKYLSIQAGTGQTPASSPLYWRVISTYVVNWDTQTDTSGTVVFSPGDYLKSQPVQLSERVMAGDKIAILGAFDSGSGSNYIPYAGSNGASNTVPFVDWVVDAAGGLPAVGSALPDTGITNQTNGNTTTANSTDNGAWMKMPYATAITGNVPDKTCIAIFGDSIAQGYGGDIRDGEPCGIFPRALDGYSWWRVAQGGNRAQCYTKSNAPWQYSVIARCSAVVVSNSLNDISGGATFAQTQSYVTRMWQALASCGPPIYAGLLTPISASSDAWATTANQSRFTGGGAIATTQYPTDDASYLTSIYGLTAMWISQDGASITTPDGATAKVGQAGHPLSGILDWRVLMSDPATSWKWLGTFTADGVHPTATAVQSYLTPTLTPQMEPLLLRRRQVSGPWPGWRTTGESNVEVCPRSMINASSPSVTQTSFATVLGISGGKIYSQIRLWGGSGSSGASRTFTVLTGVDPAKLKVLTSGTTTVAANALTTFAFSAAFIPAGQMVVLVVTAAASTANQYGGMTTLNSSLHTIGSGAVLAGLSTDTGALTGAINMFTKWTGTTFRVWAELV